ncbi:MAG: hypothetical protein ACM3WU_00160 [Bacillota bacterium]
MINKSFFRRILGIVKKDKPSSKEKEKQQAVGFGNGSKKALPEKPMREATDREPTALKAAIETAPKSSQNGSENSGQGYMSLTSVNGIYQLNKISCEGIGTVFMAEVYLKTLPDHLPSEVKRKTVIDIIRSTGVTTNHLREDGEKRKRVLADYLEEFSQTTNRLVEDHQAEIRKLTGQIKEHEKAILERKELQKEQAALVNFENQRLQGIIDFLGGDPARK